MCVAVRENIRVLSTQSEGGVLIRTSTLLALATLSLLCLQSCSLFVPSQQSLVVTATDPEAELYVDGVMIGTGTASAEVRRNKSHSIVARVGNRTGVATVGSTISVTGVLDIVGGVFFLFPFLGIAGPGFFSLDTDTVTVVVPPEPKVRN
jgi:hypothetical protein